MRLNIATAPSKSWISEDRSPAVRAFHSGSCSAVQNASHAGPDLHPRRDARHRDGRPHAIAEQPRAGERDRTAAGPADREEPVVPEAIRKCRGDRGLVGNRPASAPRRCTIAATRVRGGPHARGRRGRDEPRPVHRRRRGAHVEDQQVPRILRPVDDVLDVALVQVQSAIGHRCEDRHDARQVRPEGLGSCDRARWTSAGQGCRRSLATHSEMRISPRAGSCEVSSDDVSSRISSRVRTTSRTSSPRTCAAASTAACGIGSTIERLPTAVRTSSTSSRYSNVSGPAASRTRPASPDAASTQIRATSSTWTGWTGVPPSPGHAVDRQPAQRPREVVDQDVARAVGERRADDRPLEPARAHDGLERRLGANVGRLRVRGRVDHADVHDPPDARAPRRRE